MKKPLFATEIAWEQANLLMQPAFIRLVDNLRKQLETSSWKGDYREVVVWDESVPQETRDRVLLLQQELKGTFKPEEVAELEASLAAMPAPELSYELCLSLGDRSVTVDLWELCYRICFLGEPDLNGQTPVEIDTTLFDENEVNWIALDEKTKQIVGQIFDRLPTDAQAE